MELKAEVEIVAGVPCWGGIPSKPVVPEGLDIAYADCGIITKPYSGETKLLTDDERIAYEDQLKI